MKKLVLMVTLFVVSFAFLNADIYVKREAKSTAKQIPVSYFETWLGKNKIASSQNNMTYVVLTDTKKIFIINHTKKTYVEASLPLDIIKIMPPPMAAQAQAQKGQVTLTVTPNGKTNKILNYNCNGFNQLLKLAGMEINMTIWASKDVPFDWKSTFPLYKELNTALSSFITEQIQKEMFKIEGFQLGQEISQNGITTTITTIVLDAKKVPPAGTYSVPEGYTKKEMLEMPGM